MTSLSDSQEMDWRYVNPTIISAPQPARTAETLPASITRAASKQTYYTIRYLVDRDRVLNAYRTYAYFRWVDDRLDEQLSTTEARTAFIERQQTLMNRCYQGELVHDLSAEERMLWDLIHSDTQPDSGLHRYIQHMMAVMAFDADRRGQLIGQQALDAYSVHLATAVTEALHYFIGHGQYAPYDETRYCAVIGAHITHMLRDTADDIAAGYFNISREFVQAHQLDIRDLSSDAYRLWVRQRVEQARTCFDTGKTYLAQVKNRRCRLAGYAYMARFQGVLDTLTRHDYRLQPDDQAHRSITGGLKMGWSLLTLLARQA
ncbi:MAG: hypothetical protein CL610_13590 [Anaerolineaceae bacterium]|nr:hypothetical protein [Anaerolineaceae bacterium]